MAKVNSPIRRVGGKYHSLKHILPEIPEHDIYLEPCLGAGWVFFNKKLPEEGWRRKTWEVSLRVARDKTGDTRTECLWMNYEPVS